MPTKGVEAKLSAEGERAVEDARLLYESDLVRPLVNVLHRLALTIETATTRRAAQIARDAPFMDYDIREQIAAAIEKGGEG